MQRLPLYLKKGIIDTEKTKTVTIALSKHAENVELGYIVSGHYCLLLVRAKTETYLNPIVYDLLGSGMFMPTPYKGKKYTLVDYGVDETEIKVFDRFL